MEKIKFAGIGIQKPDFQSPQLLCYHSYDSKINNIISLVVSQVDIFVNHKKSYEPSNLTQGYTIQYMVHDEVIYISSANADFPQRICFRFLEKLKEEFELRERTLLTDKDKLNFDQHLKRLMDFFSDDTSSDQLRNIASQIDQVSGIMTDNIKAVLKKGEDLEGLMTEVNRLEANADEFQVRARKVKCTLCLQNFKWCIITAVIVLACVLVLLAIAAGVIYYFFFM